MFVGKQLNIIKIMFKKSITKHLANIYQENICQLNYLYI